MMTNKDLALQVESLQAYLSKPGNQGIRFWLESKGFSLVNRLAILTRYQRRSKP